MSGYILPAAVYSSPPRPGRDVPLKTIMEESESESTVGARSDSGGESDATVIGRPAAWDPKLFVAGARTTSRLNEAMYMAASPASDVSSPVSAGSGYYRRRSTQSVRSESDAGTVFSDTCPSLGNSSDTTSFATESTRNSLASKGSRNRYPGLVIPRPESWASNMSSPLGKSPMYKDSPILAQLSALSAARVPLTPALLSALPKHIPLITATPSLGDGSSVASETPSLTAVSAPATPDMHILHADEGDTWDRHDQHEPEAQIFNMPYSYDDVLPPPSVFSDHLDRVSRDWSDIVVNFPKIPGATPEAHTPLTPAVSRRFDFPSQNMARTEDNLSEAGVELPPDALRTLETLFGNGRASPQTPSSDSDATEKEEMKEIPIFAPRRHSMDEETPLSETSDYSFSELSIPSPGGFFASLKSNSRHTWCLDSNKKGSAPPSSATAENFYNAPWNAPTNSMRASTSIETVLEINESTLPTTSAPPTARQADFTNSHRRSNSQAIDDLDDDMYGPAVSTNKPGEIRYEYEEAYEDELKHAAEANIDRTSGWLAAQTTYMSALRETNPVNDVNEIVNPLTAHRKSASLDSPMQKAIAFMGDAAKLATTQAQLSSPELNTSPKLPKDPILHNAFSHLTSRRRRRDAFLHATPRASFIQSLRIAEPNTHLNNLLGTYEIKSPERPKYSGPFSQNPRATGIFNLTPAQTAFAQLEREQAALDLLSPSSWTVDALKYLYGGRLFASADAAARLNARANIPLTDPACIGKKRHRVLDLGGEPVGGWAWAVARELPNVKVYSVVQKSQVAAGMSVSGVAGPENHRSVSVPRLWSLPFRDGFFDVVSARSLHVLLKSEPVPGRPEIDEFDLTLREVLRVLKPGGTLEWMVMDSALKGAGPLGEKMSVELGFALKGRGYEREATRGWLARVRSAGFSGQMKRAWVCLPVGVGSGRELDERGDGKKTFRDAPRPISEVSDVGRIVDRYLDMEAVQGPVGSSRDVADLSGILGASMWEGWIVKLGLEMGRDRAKLLEGVPAVLEEGAAVGAGWRVLSGWARKPFAAEGERKSKRSDAARSQRQSQTSSTSTATRLERDMMGTIRIRAEI